MDLLALRAVLSLDKLGYEKGLKDAKDKAQGFGQSLGGIFNAAKNSIVAAGVFTAAKKGVDMLVQGVSQTAELGDHIDKASQKLGISAEAYQEWDAVLQHSGTSIDSMSVGMKTLSNAAATGKDAFNELGISTEKAASMSREDLFAETITALQNVTDENKRAQLAQELFGRSAMELGPLLNTTAEDTKAMRDRVHELGGVMSDKAVKSAAAYQNAMQDMNTAIDGAKRSLFEALMPAITSVMNAVTEFAPHIGDLIDKFQQFLPIIGAVTAAFVTYKTAVAIGSVIDAVTKATEGMSIAQAALNAVMNANPIMIVVSAIMALITALGLAYATNEDFRNAVNAAWNAVKGTIESVVGFIGRLFDGIGEKLGGLGNLFGNFISGALDWGRDLIQNFINGIQNMWGALKQKVSDVGSLIKSFLGFSEPEEGPLSNFHTYAPDMMQLFAKGITDNRDVITDAISNAFDFGSRFGETAGAGSIAGGHTFTVPRANPASAPTQINLILDNTVIGRALLPYIRGEEMRVGIQLAGGVL